MQKKSDFVAKAWQIGILSTVPFILVGGPLLGFFIGDWLDRKYAWDPYGKLALILLGVAASVREIAQIIKDVLKSDQ